MVTARGLPVPPDAERETVVRLIRRICLLREQGRGPEADLLEVAELRPALEAMRQADGANAPGPEALAAIYAAETERAINAVVVADLVFAKLSPFLAASAPTRTAASAPPPSADPSTGRPPAGSPAIPDLLDAMLAHDRSAARRRAALLHSGPGSSDKPTSH